MPKQPIAIADLNLQPFTTFGSEGVILVSGTDTLDANPMTISWGMFGIMWGKPVMMSMVRFSRHTWEFITQAPDFTVNWMPEDWTDAVRLCGRESGRNINKFEATGMTPIAGAVAASPVIAESELSLECRTLYRTDVTAEQFIDKSLLNLYAGDDFHGLFFGEVIAATGFDQFRRS